MFELITGKAGSGKTGIISSRIADAVRRGEAGSYLLVPELFSYEAQRELCRVCGDSMSLYASVTTFTALYRELTGKLGGGALPYIDDGGRLLCMSLALRELQKSEGLRYFKTNAHKSEVSGMMLSALDEMKQSSVTADMLREISPNFDESLSEKLEDLASVSLRYDELVSASHIDPSDALTMLVSLIEQSSLGPQNTFYVDGFIGFTESEYSVLRALLKKGVNMVVCLTYDKAEDINPEYQLPISTAGRLCKIADELGISRISGRPSLAEKNASYETYSCTSVLEECEFAAVKTLELIRDEGCRYRDIAIAVRGFEDYRSVLESTFEKFDIPLYTARKESLVSKPLPVFILCAHDIARNAFLSDDIIALVGTGLTCLDSSEADELCEYVFRWGLREGHWRSSSPWHQHPDGYGGKYTDDVFEKLRSINASRAKIGPALIKFTDASAAASTVYDHASALYKLLEDMEVSRRIDDSDASLWEICIHALEQMVEILGEKQIDCDEFYRLYMLMLSKYDIGSIPDSVDSVSAGDFDRMRRRNIRYLIVLGASDERLPAARKDEGLFSEDERQALNDEHLFFGGNTEDRLFREFSLIYNCFSLPSEKIFYCYFGNPSYLIPSKKDEVIKYRALKPVEPISPARGKLSNQSVTALYGNNIYISASKADKFYSCKYSYFCQYGLRARPYVEASFSYPEVGTFVHFVLENVAKEVSSLGGFASVTDDELNVMTRKYMDEYISFELNGFSEKSDRFIYLFRRVESDTFSIVLDTAKELRKSDFTPFAFELNFSDREKFAPISLNGGKDSLVMSGIADRVDEWNNDGRRFIRIVDYKTGNKKFCLSDIWHGMGMQMLLYLYALAQSEGEGTVPAGVMYVPAKNKYVSFKASPSDDEITAARSKGLNRSGMMLSSFGVPNAWETGDEKIYSPKDSEMTLPQFELLSKHITHRLGEMASCLRNGDIDADPAKKGSDFFACSLCDYCGSCGFTDGEHGESVRTLRTLDDEIVWGKMEEEVFSDE